MAGGPRTGGRGSFGAIPHRRLIRGVVIVRREDAGRVVELLRDLGAEVHARTVTLTREERESVGG